MARFRKRTLPAVAGRGPLRGAPFEPATRDRQDAPRAEGRGRYSLVKLLVALTLLSIAIILKVAMLFDISERGGLPGVVVSPGVELWSWREAYE
jgi:hypothetical protein